jgi:AcrR family transcriptional regulator
MPGAPPSPRRNLPRGRNALDRAVVESDQRSRLLDAMSELVVEHGYVALRVSDLIARAGVAKPTFYDLFESKLGCFLALIDRVFEDLTTAIASSLDPEAPIEERIARGMSALVEFVADHEAHGRILFLEAPAAGRDSLARVDRGYELLARFYISLREEVRANDPSVPPLSWLRAIAIVSTISGMISAELRREQEFRREQLTREVTEAVLSLARA